MTNSHRTTTFTEGEMIMNWIRFSFSKTYQRQCRPRAGKICMRIAQGEAGSSVRIIRAPICVFMTHPLMFLQRHDGQCIKVKWRRKNILAATRWTRLMFWSLFRSDCGRAKKIHENFLSFFAKLPGLTRISWRKVCRR